MYTVDGGVGEGEVFKGVPLAFSVVLEMKGRSRNIETFESKHSK